MNLALDTGDKIPEKIDKEYVHKKHQNNVILSKPKRFGNIWYFNSFSSNQEFNFDHPSDHLQGIFTLEISRQAGIATTHLCGLDLNGKIVLTNIESKFSNYIDINYPILVNSISRPVILNEKGQFQQYVYVNISQFGKLCVSSLIEGLAFKDNECLDSYRQRTYKINQKVKERYQQLLNEIK